MSFLTEEEDNVNATYAESINELMARARKAHESKKPQPWRGVVLSQGEAYWPTQKFYDGGHKSPSDDRYDHPKD
jgi:hypothetical protein